jgi:arabinogalactan oligomer/maltooligosaccharide transport system permease protein
MINMVKKPQSCEASAVNSPAEVLQASQSSSTPEIRHHMSMSLRRHIVNGISYLFLSVLGAFWLLPIVAVVYVSLRNDKAQGQVMPEGGLTFDYYKAILTSTSYPFMRWFWNTMIVAIFTMLISTIFVLSVAYTMSRLRFKSRKGLMNINLILGMFPGFMSMIAVYNILKAIGISGTLASLVLIYSAASGSGFYIAKGFFDTVSKSLDEAARIDGANNFKVFYKIILPLSKPIVVYTMLTSFMGPWVDYIFSSVILRDKTDNYTVALGLYKMISTNEGMAQNFTMFFAGSVLISIPIMILFMITQKYYVSGITGGSVKG